MTTITISSASINYTAGTTDCQCSVAVDVPTIGQTFVAQFVSLSSADLGPDWTDAQLCDAVAAKLGVPASDVSVAEAPAPVAADAAVDAVEADA
jgi:succinyl-CoA synthetase alpha subunit